MRLQMKLHVGWWKPLFAVALCFLYQVHLSLGVTFSYNPANSLGPQFWPSLFEDSCGRTRQSPVALVKQTATVTNLPRFRFSNYNQIPNSATVENDGHTAKVTLDLNAPATVSGGDLPYEYQFLQYHFHWGANSRRGSEHTLDGIEYPLELHLVHVRKSLINDVDTALATSDGIAVLGIFFEIGKFDNPIIQPLINSLNGIRSHTTSSSFSADYRLSDLLPLNTYNFYRYLGSLTTPRCFEAVVWTVFSSTIPISESQLQQFRGLLDENNDAIVDNYRPVQPLNGRTIYRNGLVEFSNFCFLPIICPLFENFFKTLLLVIRAAITF